MVCVKCKSPYWDKPRQIKKEGEINNDTKLMDAIFGQRLPGAHNQYFDEINGVKLYDALIAAINSIEGQNAANIKAVMLDRFGLIDGQLKTLKAVGQILNLSGSRIGQIELSGLRRLRHPSRSSKLKIYIK